MENQKAKEQYDWRSFMALAMVYTNQVVVFAIRFVKLAKNMALYTVRAPAKIIAQCVKYGFVLPFMRFCVYLMQLVLMPLNLFLVFAFDMNLYGLMNYQSVEKYGHQRQKDVLNNPFTESTLSTDEIFYSEMKRGKHGTVFSFVAMSGFSNNGVGQMHSDTTGFWLSSGLAEFSYAVYNFVVILTLFATLVGTITGFMLLIVRLCYNKFTVAMVYQTASGVAKFIVGTIYEQSGISSLHSRMEQLKNFEKSSGFENWQQQFSDFYTESHNPVTSRGSEKDSISQVADSRMTSDVYSEEEIFAEKLGGLEYLRRLSNGQDSEVAVATGVNTFDSDAFTLTETITRRISESIKEEREDE